MEDIVQGFQTPELVLLLGLGLLVLLFGYRIKKIAFFVIWFMLGFIGITYLMPEIVKFLPEVASNEMYQTLIPISGGIVLALLGFSIEKLCIGGISFLLVVLVSVQYFGTDPQVLGFSAIAGVVAAGASVMLMKPATIIATAVAGAYGITLAVLALAPEIDQTAMYWPMLIGAGVVGAGFQFFTTRGVG